MYYMSNIVYSPKNYPSAVLIRGGLDLKDGKILRGPGVLTRYLKIDKKFNDKESSLNSGLYIKDHGLKINDGQVLKLARVGVDYAGQYWAAKKWRFKIINPSDYRKRQYKNP